MEQSDQWEMSHGELATAPGPGCRVRHKSPEERTGHADRVLPLGPDSFHAAEGGEHSDNPAPRLTNMTPDDSETRTTADILLTIGKVDEDAAGSSLSDREHVGEDEHADGPGSDAFSSGALGTKRPSVVESLTLDDVQRYFSIPLKDAAVRLGISMNSLKRACRKLGISKWPYRQLRWLERNKAKMEMALRQHTVTASSHPGMGVGSSGGAGSSPRTAAAERKLTRDEQDAALRAAKHVTPAVYPRPPRGMGQPLYPLDGSPPAPKTAGDHDRENSQLHKRPRVRDMHDAMAKGVPPGPAEYMYRPVEPGAPVFPPSAALMQHPFLLPGHPYPRPRPDLYGSEVVGRPRLPPQFRTPHEYFQAYQAQMATESSERLAYWLSMSDGARMNPAVRSMHPAYHGYYADLAAYHHPHAVPPLARSTSPDAAPSSHQQQQQQQQQHQQHQADAQQQRPPYGDGYAGV